MIDPREAFLGRAAARHELYVADVMTLDDAFAALVAAFAEIMGLPTCDICSDSPCSSPGFCETCRAADKRLRRGRR